MKRWLIVAALLVAAAGTPRAQPPPSPMDSRAAELRDGITVLIAMAKQSDQAAAEATRRLEAVRAAVGGNAPAELPQSSPQNIPQNIPASGAAETNSPVVGGQEPSESPQKPAAMAENPARMPLKMGGPNPPVKSVWDFSPVAAALIQSLLLAIATLTPLVIGWVAWELRKRTGIAERQSDAAVLSNAVKNSIGAMEQSAVELGGKPEPGVATSYVLMHAGEEAERLGVNSTAIAEKVAAQMGLQSLALKAAGAAAPVHTILPPTPV